MVERASALAELFLSAEDANDYHKSHWCEEPGGDNPASRVVLERGEKRLGEWRRRARSRQELMGLSDRCLQDIGISPCTSVFETSKLFWMA